MPSLTRDPATRSIVRAAGAAGAAGQIVKVGLLDA